MSIETLIEQVRAVLPPCERPGDDELWVIDIGGGYGWFLFAGNEADAEEMRRGKAQWEGAWGRKWRVDPTRRTPADEKMAALSERQHDKTKASLATALEYPRHIATWRNYGRAEQTP